VSTEPDGRRDTDTEDTDMTGSGTGASDEVVGIDEASALLEVTPDRIEVMVAEGMLTPVGDGELRFARAEVLAARELGG
jgi:hypothetical protein